MATACPADADCNNLLIIFVRVLLGNSSAVGVRTGETERRGEELQPDKELSFLKY